MTKILKLNSEEMEVTELLESTYVCYHDLVVSVANQLEEVVEVTVTFDEAWVECRRRIETMSPRFHDWIGQSDFSFRCIQIPAFGRFHTLFVEVSSTQFSGTFSGFMELEQFQEELRIDIWNNDYPPRIYLGRKQLNQAMGQRYQKQGDEAALRTKLANLEGASSLYFHTFHRGFNPLLIKEGTKIDGTDNLIDMIKCLVERGIDLWLDGNKVNKYSSSIDFLYQTVPIFHEAVLPAGIHTLMIGLKNEHRILFDGEILMDGIRDVLVRIEEIGTNTTVKIERGTEMLYSGVSLKLPFTEIFKKKPTPIQKSVYTR